MSYSLRLNHFSRCARCGWNQPLRIDHQFSSHPIWSSLLPLSVPKEKGEGAHHVCFKPEKKRGRPIFHLCHLSSTDSSYRSCRKPLKSTSVNTDLPLPYSEHVLSAFWDINFRWLTLLCTNTLTHPTLHQGSQTSGAPLWSLKSKRVSQVYLLTHTLKLLLLVFLFKPPTPSCKWHSWFLILSSFLFFKAFFITPQLTILLNLFIIFIVYSLSPFL